MAKIAQLCEGLEESLEFRDDLVERMALKNSERAVYKCNCEF